jgi:uncharacterized protein (TIGR00255 family)
MKSMTGFGSASISTPEFELDINVKSVNGRFLDLRLHLPREYSPFESEMKKHLGQIFFRGTVDVYFNRRLGPAGESLNVKVQTALAEKYLNALQTLTQTLKLSGQPSLEMLLRFPDVIKTEELKDLSGKEKAQVIATLLEATKACDQERVREGLSLKKEFGELLSALDLFVKSSETLRTQANEALEKRYQERLAKFGFEGQIEPQRLAQEVVMQLERADISEEISRLREHLKAYRELLNNPVAQGKKLDFYAQELLRELNTIGSKSHVAELTQAVVEAKTVIERVREQVQNVE